MNKEVLLEEAKAIMSCHPSKDARAFARSVLLYFKEVITAEKLVKELKDKFGIEKDEHYFKIAEKRINENL